jgi:acetolactate synthase-1/2/3 large subunit
MMAQQPAQQPEKMLVDTLRPSAEMALKVKEDPTAQEKINLGFAMADLLKEEGVEYCFYLSGGGTATTIYPLQQQGIKCVHVRHEQSAGFAMDAWGRITRRPGFAIPGAGTGLTAFSTGLCQAYSAGSPGVVLQAESGPFDDLRYGGQGVARAENQFRGMAKWVLKINQPNVLLMHMKRAFRDAVTPPYGPVALAYGNSEITAASLNAVQRRVAYQAYVPGYWNPKKLEKAQQVQANPEIVQELVKWLLEAEKPVIVAGHEAHQDDCQEELREFIHLLGIPATGRRIARGIVSELDPLNYGRRARGPVFAVADKCLVLGLRIGSLEGWGNAPFFPHNIRYAQAHSSPVYTEVNLPTDIEIYGNLKMMLKQMIQCAKDMGVKGPVAKWENWRKFIVDTDQSYKKRILARTDRMVHMDTVHPDLVGRYTAEVGSEEYNNNYISIIDGYTGSAYFTGWNVCTNTGTTLDATETIGFGHSAGMALGAGLATNRNVPIFAVMGDGAIGFSPMDIETCTRWNIPAVFLHENNDNYINGAWELFGAKLYAPEGIVLHDSCQVTPNIRYDKMMGELGAKPFFVDKPEQLKPAISQAFKHAMQNKLPAFIEVFVDKDVVHSNMASPLTMITRSNTIKWSDMPEKGKSFVAQQIANPQILPRFSKDWQDGIAEFNKK